MANFKIGDIVARKSYDYDIFFKVVDIKKDGEENIITLKGILYRIQADAPETDLVAQSDSKVRAYKDNVYRDTQRRLNSKKAYVAQRQHYNFRRQMLLKKGYYRDTANDKVEGIKRPGKVLHLDGDQDYLEICITEYKKLGMDVVGKHIQEREQPTHVYKLLLEHKPDILVLTGHDGISKGLNDYNDINSYINSKHFINAVKEARRYNPDMDGLVIFAGACQSMYYEILKNGANFASAPQRVLIHALDPVMVTEKLAFESVDKIIMPQDVINNTITGLKGIGGFQTRGTFRNGYPKETYNS
jgi:spore coat assembly protein